MLKPKRKSFFIVLIFLSSACLIFSFLAKNVKANPPVTGTASLPTSPPTATGGSSSSTTATSASPAPEVESGEDASINAAAGWFFGIIMNLFFTIATLVIAIAGKLFNWAFSIQTFKGIAAVDTTWKLLRDLCNMFFIVILMISAIATILRVSKYQFTNILRPLLIAIIAINFSKTITYVVVDFTQVLSHSFLAVTGAAENEAGAFQISEQLANNMGLTAIFKAPTFWGKGGDSWQFTGTWDMVWSTLFAAIVMLVAGVALAVGAVMLIVRLVMIWILIAVSSAAWGLSAFPDFKQYYDLWWKKLTHYAFFAPKYALYVGFALILVRGGGYAPMKGDLLTGGGAGDFFKFSGYFINYLITIIILFWAVGQAKGMDKYLGGQALDWAAGKGQKFLNSFTMPRTRSAIMAEHKAREAEKEKLKQETAKDRAAKAYKPKDWAHGKIAAADTGIRGAARAIPGAGVFVREKAYGTEVLENRKKSEANKERLDKTKEYKDTPPSQSKFADVFIDNKKSSEGEKQALAQYLGENTGNFDSNPDRAFTQFENAVATFGKDETSKNGFIRKVKKSRVDLVARYNSTINRTAIDVEMQQAIAGMGAKDIADQAEIVFTQNGGNNPFIATVNNILTGGNFNRQDLIRSGASSNKLRHIP